MTNLDSILKSRDIANKGPSSQGYGFSISHVWMWELNYKESRVQKNRCFWTVVLEKTLESPLDCKEIQPVHSKGNQSWIFIGRTDAEAETLILCPPDAKNWLLGKRPRCWERLKAGGEGVNRGWDGWMTSLIQWTWVWASSRNWWWIGRPDVLHSMGLQGVGHYWATELNWWEREHYLQIERLTLSLYIGYRLYKDRNLCLFWSLIYLRMATNTMQALSKCLLNKWMIPVLYPCLVGRTTSN